MKARKKKKPINRQSNVNYDTYSGASGSSSSRSAAEKMWASKASADELKLGSKTTMDKQGNYIVRTKTSSKAQ